MFKFARIAGGGAAIVAVAVACGGPTGPRAGGAEDLEARGPKGCPASASPGKECGELSAICSYGEKSACVCESTSCTTPAGPIPDCKRVLVWRCRDDGCPVVFGPTCALEGQVCVHDDGMCRSTLTCTGGKWNGTERACRP